MPLSLSEVIVSVVLSFTVINLSSAIGAQANTTSDYELDSRDDRKLELVQAFDSLACMLIVRSPDYCVQMTLVI